MKEPNATSQYQLLQAKNRVAWRSQIFLLQLALYKRTKAPILKTRLNSWQCGFLRAYLFLPFIDKCLQKIEYAYTNKPYQNNYLQYCTVLSPLTTPQAVLFVITEFKTFRKKHNRVSSFSSWSKPKSTNLVTLRTAVEPLLHYETTSRND